MKHTLVRLIAATALLCGGNSLAWAQGAAALDATELAPLYNQVPMASIDTHESWSKRGVYGLFASKRGRVLLRLLGFTVGKDGLVYVGKTENSFAERLSNHRRGHSNLSGPLKRVLGANATHADVTRFIRRHLRVGLLPLDDAARIDAVERRLIQTRRPPLNTAGLNNGGSNALVTRATDRIGATRMLAKGGTIMALVELPVTAIVETLHVRNGRKTAEEALADGGRAVSTAAAVGATVGAIAAGAAAAGVTIPAAVPVGVVASGAYVWVSGKRVWNALDDDTRASVNERLEAAGTAVENRLTAAGTMFADAWAAATATVGGDS